MIHASFSSAHFSVMSSSSTSSSSVNQPRRLSPELKRAIELMHSDEPLPQEDKDLIRAHRDELQEHVPADIRRIWDFLDGNVRRQPQADGSHLLPQQIVLEDAATGTSRPAIDWSHPLPRQVEAEAAVKEIEEEYIRLLIELGRAERERKKKRD
uniref:Uncharacterized protein n=1 Tax=Setaria viridis TaxID=4556 RepID=A0A4U6UG59_SETVI|nr:hypothetical protein SEVIR_6G095100v2 [Setaria viridis]